MLEYVGITLSTWDLFFFFEDPPHRQHMVFLGASIMADAYEQQARDGSLIGNWLFTLFTEFFLDLGRRTPDSGFLVRNIKTVVLVVPTRLASKT